MCPKTWQIISDFFERLNNLTRYIYFLAIRWQEQQIESLTNVYFSIFKYGDDDRYFQEETRYVYKTQSLSQIFKEMKQDKNACEDQLLMVVRMLEYMGLSEKGACQYVQLLRKLPDNNSSAVYIRTLCEIWHKYKMMDVLNNENMRIDEDGLIMMTNAKTTLHKTFHYLLIQLLNISEGADEILETHNKHQLDILKSFELQLLMKPHDTNELILPPIKSIKNLEPNNSLIQSLPDSRRSDRYERLKDQKARGEILPA